VGNQMWVPSLVVGPPGPLLSPCHPHEKG
jgi:hypothetical protein